jgi:hypothetical protein
MKVFLTVEGGKMKNNAIAKAFIRAPYAWPGGYPMFGLTQDNGILCHRCARDNVRLVLGEDPQWAIVAAQINWESELYCDNCSTKIEAAYEN